MITGNLKRVIEAISVLVTTDMHKHNRSIEESKMQRPKDLRRPMFRAGRKGGFFRKYTP